MCFCQWEFARLGPLGLEGGRYIGFESCDNGGILLCYRTCLCASSVMVSSIAVCDLALLGDAEPLRRG